MGTFTSKENSLLFSVFLEGKNLGSAVTVVVQVQVVQSKHPGTSNVVRRYRGGEGGKGVGFIVLYCCRIVGKLTTREICILLSLKKMC